WGSRTAARRRRSRRGKPAPGRGLNKSRHDHESRARGGDARSSGRWVGSGPSALASPLGSELGDREGGPSSYRGRPAIRLDNPEDRRRIRESVRGARAWRRRNPAGSPAVDRERGGTDNATAWPTNPIRRSHRMIMTKILLLRHGESIWNKENLFTGWYDIDLSDQGKVEAKHAGELLKAEGFTFDVAFTSVLKRAIRTLWTVLDELDLMWIPVEHSWRLNERHYGALQGLNKAQTAAKYGDEQVLIWRRSYDIPPPALEESDPRFPGTDPRYRGLNRSELPRTECLKDTVARF